METIYRLVLTNGMVITSGDPWPGPDGKPFSINGNPIAAHVWLIVFVPETVTAYSALEDGSQVSESDPAHYELLMRGNDQRGFKNEGGLEETQVYRIESDKVLFAGQAWSWKEALEHFGDLLGGAETPTGNGGATVDTVATSP